MTQARPAPFMTQDPVEDARNGLRLNSRTWENVMPTLSVRWETRVRGVRSHRTTRTSGSRRSMGRR